MAKQVAVRMNRPIKFRVLDSEDTHRNPLDVVVSTGPSGLLLDVQGCGLMEMDDSHGEIVQLQYVDGKLQLNVWADINQPEPTHQILLHNAKLSNRQPTAEAVAEAVLPSRREKQEHRAESSNARNRGDKSSPEIRKRSRPGGRRS